MSVITTDQRLALADLKAGKIVAIPTETVYGLAADAYCESAIRQVFAVKGRPVDHPLIMHVSANWDLTTWVTFVPTNAKILIKAFWPGPLTLILDLKPNAISPLVTGGQTTIAIRAPAHVAAQALLNGLGRPLVAPSANPFGKISPTTALHVQTGFPTEDFLILDGGRCDVGIESTIVRVTEQGYKILRAGTITIDAIAACLNSPLLQNTANLRVPGKLEQHYQPIKPLWYTMDVANIIPYANQLGKKPYVLTFSAFESMGWPCYRLPQTVNEAAYELYYQLRVADDSAQDCIIIELPPNHPQWEAIAERIMKAGRKLQG